MKNVIKWKDYTIWRWFVVFENDELIAEFFDSIHDAEKCAMAEDGRTLKYAAAEEINDDGDLNPAVYGDTLKEVMDKIKKVLL